MLTKVEHTGTNLIPRWQDGQAPKTKKSKWYPAPDTILECETLDEHATETMLKSNLYTRTIGEGNRSNDKWKYVANTGEVLKGDPLDWGTQRLYSVNSFNLLSKCASRKADPRMDDDQLRQECDENTATISKISMRTLDGLKAHFVTKTENQKRIDRGAAVVFHPADTSVNTVTNTVQLRADKTPPSSDCAEDGPMDPSEA